MPVKEADQLLATQIAYADLDQALKVLTALGKTPVTLEAALEYAVANECSLAHFEKYLGADGKLKAEYSYANDWVIVSAVNENNPSGSGLYACILDTGASRILACRGSEDMSNMMNWEQDWFHADLQLLNSEMTTQEAALYRYMKNNAQLLNEKPWVATGHSLGGALADFAAIMSVEFGLDRFSGATNFDGPGHSEEFIKKYQEYLAQVASKMKHKKASVIGNLLFDLPGVATERVETSPQSQFTDKDGNPYSQVTEIGFLAEHDTQNWVRNPDGSLKEGEQDWYEFLAEKMSRGLDRLPSCIGNCLPYIINAAFVGANWMKDFYEDHPTLVKAAALGVGVLLLTHPAAALMTIQAVGVALVAVVVVLAVVIVGEIIVEVIEAIAEAVAQAVCAAVSWLHDKAVELCQAVKEAIRSIGEWLRSVINQAGVRYASTNPFFKADTGKLRDYAVRINNVNNRLRTLDSDLRGLYWQVGLLDIWDILTANLVTSESPTLNQVRSYLNNAADRLETAERKAIGYMGG